MTKNGEDGQMICTCDHRDCWFVFETAGNEAPEKCPDCGKRSVRTATEDEILWFFREHGEEKAG